MPDDRMMLASPEQPDWKRLIAPTLMALGAVSLIRTSRLATLALVGAYLFDHARVVDSDRHRRGVSAAAKRAAEERLDAALADSFPASDPPAYSGASS